MLVRELQGNVIKKLVKKGDKPLMFFVLAFYSVLDPLCNCFFDFKIVLFHWFKKPKVSCCVTGATLFSLAGVPFRRVWHHQLWTFPNKTWKASLFIKILLDVKLLRLCETQNALQLPVFFFFSLYCQLYPGLRNCKSVFLILKISQYGKSRRWL